MSYLYDRGEFFEPNYLPQIGGGQATNPSQYEFYSATASDTNEAV